MGSLGGVVKENPFELGSEFFTLLFSKRVEIVLPSADRREVARAWHVEQGPVRLAEFEGNQRRCGSDICPRMARMRVSLAVVSSSMETSSTVIPSNPRRHSSEMYSRLGARISAIGRL